MLQRDSTLTRGRALQSDGRPFRVYMPSTERDESQFGDWQDEIVPGCSRAFRADWNKPKNTGFDAPAEIPTITPGVTCVGPWVIQSRSDHQTIHQANMVRLRSADAVFAFFEFGTASPVAFDIGVAHALGKPVYLGFDGWMQRPPWVVDLGENVASTVQELWLDFCNKVVRLNSESP